MRFYGKHYLGVLAVLILAMSAWAGKNSSHTDSMNLDVDQATMVGDTQLQPGHYTIQAKEDQNQVDILRDGKVIATVPCHWVKLPKKADSSTVSADDNRVSGVQFEGRDEAVKIG